MGVDDSEDVLQGTIVGVNAVRRREVRFGLQTTGYVVRLDDGREVTAILDIPRKKSYSAFSCRSFHVQIGKTKVRAVLGTVFDPIRIVSMDGELKF
jgi:hypothetical protein